MGATLQVVCPQCGKINRVPFDRVGDGANCGGCHRRLFQGKVLKLDGDSMKKHVQKNQIPLLVDFWAPWCGPCKMMAPVLDQAAGQYEPRLRIAKLNTDDYPEAAAPYGIRGIPTLILFKKGREADRISGAVSLQQLGAWLNQHL